MKKFIKENWFKIIIAICVIILTSNLILFFDKLKSPFTRTTLGSPRLNINISGQLDLDLDGYVWLDHDGSIETDIDGDTLYLE